MPNRMNVRRKPLRADKKGPAPYPNPDKARIREYRRFLFDTHFGQPVPEKYLNSSRTRHDAERAERG